MDAELAEIFLVWQHVQEKRKIVAIVGNKFLKKLKMLPSALRGHCGRSPSEAEVLILVEHRYPSEVEGSAVIAVNDDKNHPCRNPLSKCFAPPGLGIFRPDGAGDVTPLRG